QTGLELARSTNPDIIVLDLMLPLLNGMEVCKILRAESGVPIIMLTAKGAQLDRINGLESGADDYIVKPFDPDELIARAKAVLRRTQGKVQKSLRYGILSLNESTQDVRLAGEEIKLSQAQFALLSAFMRHPNQVLSRYQLIALAFNNDFDAYDRAIDTHIRRLRKLIHKGDFFDAYDRAIDTHIRRLRKLIHKGDFQPIQTVYGAGYKFVEEDN
ncbi:MAG: response regulator transcription factor, partial [Deltaproteobacteria bacterium]|nr:response regulator transcription factor [Deltaproteobacteria bacterium]